MERVLLLYKKEGETPLACIRRFQSSNKEYIGISMTYAGRLDPMAEGLLLVLTGEECKQKLAYLNLSKTYSFEVLWGFTTDTFDILGLVNDKTYDMPKIQQVKDFISKYIGKRVQTYPAYSSKTVLGKPLFVWAREGNIKNVQLPTHEVEIFSCLYKGERVVRGNELVSILKERINKVQGDFRQAEIVDVWDKNINKDQTYTITKIEMSCSGGTYVRAFVSDIVSELKTCGVTFGIQRTAIGTYTNLIKDQNPLIY